MDARSSTSGVRWHTDFAPNHASQMLFHSGPRTDHEPASHLDGEFDFLDRSARPAAERVRVLLESWAEDYPESEGAALGARLRAEFEATFFEMFLFQVLCRLGCEVELHPLLAPTTARPDFLARFANGRELILEARVATDKSDAERREAARAGALFDEIKKIESPDFFLSIDEVSNPSAKQPSGRRVRAFIKRQIAELDPDEVAARLADCGPDSLPSWKFEEDGFEFTFSVVPKSPEARGKPGPAIGIYPSESRSGGSSQAIRDSIFRKVAKYGPATSPFVVAVNTLTSWGSNRTDVAEALLGSEQVVWSPHSSETRLRRAPNGVWGRSEAPRNRHLSAVVGGSVFPWNLPVAPVCVYHNPYAQYPCTDLDWCLPQALVADGRLAWTDGVEPGVLLGLQSDWPGKLFD
jgi:hypothetical protein